MEWHSNDPSYMCWRRDEKHQLSVCSPSPVLWANWFPSSNLFLPRLLWWSILSQTERACRQDFAKKLPVLQIVFMSCLAAFVGVDFAEYNIKKINNANGNVKLRKNTKLKWSRARFQQADWCIRRRGTWLQSDKSASACVVVIISFTNLETSCLRLEHTWLSLYAWDTFYSFTHKMDRLLKICLITAPKSRNILNHTKSCMMTEVDF